MNKLDALRTIGDVITEIDVARGSLMPDDPNRRQLDDLRALLDDRQRRLSQAIFDDNTQQFKDAADRLQSVNTDIRATIQDLNRITDTINSINKFLSAVTSLMTTAGLFL